MPRTIEKGMREQSHLFLLLCQPVQNGAQNLRLQQAAVIKYSLFSLQSTRLQSTMVM